jgi:tRNA(Met) cytidine acetyltransferase
MDLARSLIDEARATTERRMLVLTGEAEHTRARARDALAAAGISEADTTLLGPTSWLDCECHDQSRAVELLGRTRQAVVLDASQQLRPNALGAAVGAVNGGGVVVLLAPPLDEWPDRRDGFDESLAVPPLNTEAVTGHFRRRIVSTLRAHRGIGIVSVTEDTTTVEKSGLVGDQGGRISQPVEPPTEYEFEPESYDACRTDDQVAALHSLESLRESGNAVVIEADRGRGKSSAAGLAAANLACDGRTVLVTAPKYRNVAELFERAAELLETLGVSHEYDQQELSTANAVIRFVKPDIAVDVAGDSDVVIVDEAAALPVRRLEAMLDAPSVAFVTTVHGYEGTGRGFQVRFRERLAESRFSVTETTMTMPIRYADADPIEVWVFRALMLDARPPVSPLITDATPDTVSYRRITSAELLENEHLLRELFGLLVLAHYRTEPTDLARLLDGPNISVRALTYEGHVVAVALLAREGGLDSDTRARMYDGERVRGNMLPDVLSTQLRDEAAGEPTGQRVLRIATHDAVRSCGLGSHLLDSIHEEFDSQTDWIGVGYGATPQLVRFWRQNGFRTVHLSTSRNRTSGEYSAIMLSPCSSEGDQLLARHTERFHDRIAATLTDALDDCDPDVVREVVGGLSVAPDPDLSPWEWRLVASVPGGGGVLDTNPDPFRRLAIRHLAAPPDQNPLTDREERLLVRKVLQANPWQAVGDELGYPSTPQCKRAIGTISETLTRQYGDTLAHRELDRHI